MPFRHFTVRGTATKEDAFAGTFARWRHHIHLSVRSRPIARLLTELSVVMLRILRFLLTRTYNSTSRELAFINYDENLTLPSSLARVSGAGNVRTV